ncbi:MAG: FUSC family protein [Sarcina sp.]
MIKSIISKTLLFIAILVYVVIFKTIFGDDNTLIAVMSITGLLMFMGRDLTGEPIKNMLGLILFYVLIGVGSFIVVANMWIAIPINFIIIFAISYNFGHVLKGPMYIPFSLLYLFLLASPVSIHELPTRIIALIVGAISIMLPQFLINKNKIEKVSEKIFASAVKLLISKIEIKEKGQEVVQIDAQLNPMFRNLKNIIFDKKEKQFYITDQGQKSLDILVSLENINTLINENKLSKEMCADISEFLTTLSSVMAKKDKSIKMIECMTRIARKYHDTTNLKEIEAITSIKIIALTVSNYKTTASEKVKSRAKDLKSDIYGLKNIKFNSIKLTYAVRISIAVAVACFIMQYFHLEQGRWVMYTVLSLTNPLLEVTKSKAKDRIIATIIGAVIIIILFTIFKSTTIRSLIVMGAGYANIYCKTYRQSIISVTISAVGAAALVGGTVISGGTMQATPLVLSVERAGLILLGVVIALFINTFLFKFNVKRANNHLENISDLMVTDLIKTMDKILEGKNVEDYLNNVYLLNSQIQHTIENNRSQGEDDLEDQNYEKLRTLKNNVIASAYEFENLATREQMSEAEKQKLVQILDKLKNPANISIEELNERAKAAIQNETLSNKIKINLLFDMKRNIQEMKICK